MDNVSKIITGQFVIIRLAPEHKMNRSHCNHGNCVRPRRLFVFRYDSCSYVVPDLEKKEKKKKTRLTQKCFIFPVQRTLLMLIQSRRMLTKLYREAL